MRAGFVVTEAILIALISAIFGLYAEKNVKVTNYIYSGDNNSTTILWMKIDD